MIIEVVSSCIYYILPNASGVGEYIVSRSENFFCSCLTTRRDVKEAY